MALYEQQRSDKDGRYEEDGSIHCLLLWWSYHFLQQCGAPQKQVVEAQVLDTKECKAAERRAKKKRLCRLKNTRREELEGRMERERSMLGKWGPYRRKQYLSWQRRTMIQTSQEEEYCVVKDEI